MSDVIALFQTTYFTTGLRLGIVALALGWAIRFITGRYRPPLPIGGLLFAAATLGGLYWTAEPLGTAWLAFGAIVVGALLVRVFKAPAWAQLLAVAPGAVWLAFATPATELLWVRVLMAVLIPVAGFLINDFETRHDRLGLGLIFFTLAVLGSFAAVPDTEQVLVLTAASLAITLLAWPKVAVSLGMEGSYVAVAALLWVTAAGGGGRPPSIAGASACLGLLLLEPIIVLVRPAAAQLADRVRRNWLGAVLASIPQFILVIISSRIAARFSIMLPALLIVGVGYALALGAGIRIGSRDPEPRESAPSPF